MLLHDTAANDSSPSGQINQKSYSLSHQVLKILFSKFHYIPALLSAHGKNRGEPCVSCPLSIQNQLWCHPVPSFPGLFRPSIHPEVPEIRQICSNLGEYIKRQKVSDCLRSMTGFWNKNEVTQFQLVTDLHYFFNTLEQLPIQSHGQLISNIDEIIGSCQTYSDLEKAILNEVNQYLGYADDFARRDQQTLAKQNIISLPADMWANSAWTWPKISCRTIRSSEWKILLNWLGLPIISILAVYLNPMKVSHRVSILNQSLILVLHQRQNNW